MRVTDKHVFFFGKQDVFSQWHPCSFVVNGVQFSCAEQAMMYFKAQVFEDQEIAAKILESDNPKEHKALGRKVKNFDADVWNDAKNHAVVSINFAKFEQNPELKSKLLETGNRDLVEASPYDRIWGIGMGANAPGVDDPKNWKGKNLLGICLVTVRSLIRGLDEMKGVDE